MTTKTPPLTLAEAELIVGSPATSWIGRCSEISDKLADAYRGEAVYGHWLGPVDETSPFAYARSTGFAQHGWIEIPDGSVVDPTRFGFEMVTPYIYVGPSDHYDRGGNAMLARLNGLPPEDPDDGKPPVSLPLPSAAAHVVFAMTGWKDPADLAWIQVHWLAHVSPEVYGEHAEDIFRAIRDAGEVAMIPIDNWRWVMGDEGEEGDDES